MSPLAAFTAIASLTDEPLVLADSEARIVLCNAAFAKQFGRPANELSGELFVSLCEETPERVAESFATWRRSTAQTPARFALRFASGVRACRVQGRLLAAADPARHVVLRIAAGDADAFVLLRQKVEELSFEVQQRKLAEQRARLAAERIDALRQLGNELASALSRSEVARITVTRGRAAVAADLCTLHWLDPDSNDLILADQQGVAAEVIAQIQRIDGSSPQPVSQTLHTGVPLWVQSAAEYRALMPELATLPSSSPRALAFSCIPLIVEGRPLGVLGMGYFAEREFNTDERRFMLAFAHQCGEALRRAERIESEREARSVAERARQSLQTTLSSIGDAVIATDAGGFVTFANPVAELLTGWSQTEAIGRPLCEVFAIMNEHTRQPVESPVDKVLRLGTVAGLANHTLLLAKNGAEIPIDDSAAPIRDETGAIGGVVLVFRDVTAKKRAETRRSLLAAASAAFSESLDYKATLRRIAELAVPELADWCAVDVASEGGTPERIAVVHSDPRHVALARELDERFPRDWQAQRGAPAVLRSGIAEFYPEISDAMLAASARSEDHLALVRALRPRSAVIVPVRGERAVLGALSLVYAESDRRYTRDDLEFAEEFARRAGVAVENARLYAAEKRAHERADRANRAKDEFLATVSHELRTPLNAILGWTRLLATSADEPERRARAIEVLERNAIAMAQLIEDLLDVSRIVSGKLRLDVQPVDLPHVIHAAIDAVKPASEARGVQLTVILGSTGPINGDPARLQQVVWNLLSNAVKFTPQGGRVEIVVREHESNAEISVSDTGQGIHPRFLPHVFEPFRQEDATTVRKHGGIGLGLAITKHLVELHGGSLRAASPGPGQGATFTVLLPLSLVWNERSSVASHVRRFVASEHVERPDALRGVRVLVVDDDEDARQLTRVCLEECGCSVSTAATAREALLALAESPPDVLLSDIGMPGENGYELIRQVRELPDPRVRHIPAAALTAYARAEDRKRVLKAGYLMHVPKPVEPAELVAIVESLVRMRGDG